MSKIIKGFVTQVFDFDHVYPKPRGLPPDVFYCPVCKCGLDKNSHCGNCGYDLSIAEEMREIQILANNDGFEKLSNYQLTDKTKKFLLRRFPQLITYINQLLVMTGYKKWNI